MGRITAAADQGAAVAQHDDRKRVARPACRGASAVLRRSAFVPFESLAANPKAYLGRRVRTHGQIESDGKEYTRVVAHEGSEGSLLLEATTKVLPMRGGTVRTWTRGSMRATTCWPS